MKLTTVPSGLVVETVMSSGHSAQFRLLAAQEAGFNQLAPVAAAGVAKKLAVVKPTE